MRPESNDSAARTELREMVVRLVHFSEQPRYQELMREHHYLGHLPKIGETLWYVARWREQWVALLSFSASALKCAARDRWIGWSFCHQYARLKLVVNNSRFLILPDWHLFNLGSRVLSLCQRRLPRDWEAAFGHGAVLLETFVDPQRHRGTVYRAANWIYVGNTRGFRRTRVGYTATPASPKMVFLKLLRADARRLLCRAMLSPPYHLGGTTMRLTAEQMRSLPYFFSQLPDPRRSQGRRHRLSTVLGIAAGAVLCGMRGYKAIADWAQSLGQKSRERFGSRREQDHYVVPSESIRRNVLIRVTPADLDRALQCWNERYGAGDESLAIDGKTMCNALDEQGQRTHVMSVVGHQSKICYTQKKVGTLPIEDKGKEEVKCTNEIKTAIPLLEAIDIEGKDVSGDALLTQRELADYLVGTRKTHYYFTVKGNQPGLLEALEFYFRDRGQPYFVEHTPPDHGRIETRKIWTTTELNGYLDFPHVGQAFVNERRRTDKKSGESSLEVSYGLTSCPGKQAGPQRVLKVNRGHWVIERIRTGHGPENITRLRRFAIGVLKSKGRGNVAEKMRRLTRNVRLVFDYLRMSENSGACHLK